MLATEYNSAWAVRQSYRYDPLGQPAATRTGAGAVFYYHHDARGSPLDVTSSTGPLHQRWAYAPYGTRVLGAVTTGTPGKLSQDACCTGTLPDRPGRKQHRTSPHLTHDEVPVGVCRDLSGTPGSIDVHAQETPDR